MRRQFCSEKPRCDVRKLQAVSAAARASLITLIDEAITARIKLVTKSIVTALASSENAVIDELVATVTEEIIEEEVAKAAAVVEVLKKTCDDGSVVA